MFLILSLCFFVSDSLSNQTGQLEGRVLKGSEVGIHQFSYAVFLHFEKSRPRSCGGSLIMVQAVLTAAHCVDELRYNNGEITAYFGASVPVDSKVRRKVIDYIVHPKYDKKKIRADVAVLFLDNRVPLMHEIKKIPLAVEDPGIDVETEAAGWGKQIRGKFPDFSDRRHLKFSRQKLISGKVCSDILGLKKSNKRMCSESIRGHFSRDDAGSGLVINTLGQFLVGVLANATDDIAFYTNVYAERAWIIQSCHDLYVRNCPNRKNKGRK